jgi:hypothetical protein
MPNLSHPACVCDSRCNFAGKKIKEAHANEKSGTATEIEKSIVKKMAGGLPRRRTQGCSTWCSSADAMTPS